VRATTRRGLLFYALALQLKARKQRDDAHKRRERMNEIDSRKHEAQQPLRLPSLDELAQAHSR
jgi:hypothetical protein